MSSQPPEEPHSTQPLQPYPTQPYPAQPYPAQPYPAHPNAAQWPAYRPAPPKPEKPLRGPLTWAAFFSLVGVVIIALIVAFCLFLLYAGLWFLIAMIGAEPWDFWGELSSAYLLDELLGPLGLFFLIVSVVMFAMCAGVLLLLRIGSDFRRWPAPLQGLTAAAIVYFLGVFVLPTVGGFISSIAGL